MAVLAAWALTISPVSAADFVLVSGGEPQARIVQVDQQAGEPLQFSVQELHRYLQAMSCVHLPLVDQPGDQPAIVLSAEPPRNDTPPGGEDRYLLEVTDQRITIRGAGPRAALYAVYDLLERLGCGWCVPGDDTVPKRATLALAPVKVESGPAFRYRFMLDYPLMSVAQSRAIVDWLAKNRLNWVHPCPNTFGEPKAWYERRDQVFPRSASAGCA